MFITRQTRQTRENAPVSARSRFWYADTSKAHGRARNERERHVGDCGTLRGRYSADGAASLAPFGRDIDQFSRHAFLGVIAV